MDRFPRQCSDLGALGDNTIEFVSQVDVDFSQRVVGANATLIDRYAESLGASAPGAIPLSLRSFFQSFGLGHGGLLDPFVMEVNLERYLRMYVNATEFDPMSTRLVVLANYVVGDQVSIDLDSPGQEHEVVGSSGDERLNYLAPNLEQFVAKAAFLFREQQQSTTFCFSASVDDVKRVSDTNQLSLWTRGRVQEFFVARGADTVWISDTKDLVMCAEDTSVFLSGNPSGAFMLRVFSRAGRFDEAIERFAVSIGAGWRGVATPSRQPKFR